MTDVFEELHQYRAFRIDSNEVSVMCMRELARTNCAAVALLACAALLPPKPVQAQTAADLQELRFHAVPLADLATEDSCNCALAAGDEVVDMALFEEASTGSYLRDIAEIRGAAGSYAPELTERFTSAALLYQQQNRHEEALGILAEAVASSRIHAGLYSREQVFLAQKSIESLLALRRFDEAEDRYAQILNIHRRIDGPAAVQTAHALLGLGKMQLRRLEHELAQPGGGTQQRVYEAPGALDYVIQDTRFDSLYATQVQIVNALHILIDAEAWTDPALLELEQQLVQTYYLDAARARLVAHPGVLAGAGETAHARMRTRGNRAALPEQYLKGEQAYLRMAGYLKRNPDAALTEVADVLLRRADWNLLFGNHLEAREQYRQLAEHLEQAGVAPEEAAAILQPAVPVALPAFADYALAAAAAQETADARGHVDVSFSVDHLGRARDFAVLAVSDGADAAVIAQLEKLVRNALFRPTDSADTGFRLRYYFFY